MNISYTNEEFRKLTNFIPKQFCIHSAINEFLQNGCIITNNPNSSVSYKSKKFFVIYHSIEKYTYYKMNAIYKYMFQIPLENLPLLLDNRNPSILSIIKWRLFLGK